MRSVVLPRSGTRADKLWAGVVLLLGTLGFAAFLVGPLVGDVSGWWLAGTLLVLLALSIGYVVGRRQIASAGREHVLSRGSRGWQVPAQEWEDARKKAEFRRMVAAIVFIALLALSILAGAFIHSGK